MSRRNKPKQARTAYRDGEAPTPEQLARLGHVRIEAPQMPGHDTGNHRLYKRQHPANVWLGSGWVTPEGAAKLIWWDDLRLTANHDRIRSCCDDTPRGLGGVRSERMIDAGREHARVQLLLVGELGAHNVRALVHFLSHDGGLGEAYRDAFGPARVADCYERARSLIVRAGRFMETLRA